MIETTLDGTQRQQFSIGVGNGRVDIRTNSGVIEVRRNGGQWFSLKKTTFSDLDPVGSELDTSLGDQWVTPTALWIAASFDETSSDVVWRKISFD